MATELTHARHAEDPAPGRHEEEGQRRHDERDAAGEQRCPDVERSAEDDADRDDQLAERRDLVKAADLGSAEVEVGPEPTDDLQGDRGGDIGPGDDPHAFAEHELVSHEQEPQQGEQP